MIMKKRRVVITGMGVVSPFGVGVECYWQGLRSGQSALRTITGFDAARYRSAQGMEVPAEVYRDREACAACGSPYEDSAYFLSLAANEALGGAGVGPVFDDADRVGCVLGTLCAGTQNFMKVAGAYAAGEVPDEACPVDGTLVHYQLDFLARRHNLTGPSSLVSTACASSTDAIGYAFDLIRHGECDSALAGGADVLTEPIHGGFNALFSITTNRPRPFDRDRDGFVIGEGGGLFYLETIESAQARGADILAEVLGYGLSNTAFHLTATSEDGTGEALSIRRALEDAGLRPDEVDYINTHGTATRHNDATEILAINTVFGAHAPRIAANSIKAAIGHCMGAAGVMEALSTVLAIKHQEIPPTPFTEGNEGGLVMALVAGEARKVPIRFAVSESFGFGGACSCLVLARAEEGR